ncbi:MAG: hypothetical protein R3256_09130 [Thalassovita sp.]|nr:hypothetical protein [Thalassovita sp.]
MHRVPTGWHRVGSVPFDSDDLTAALSELRETAFRLEPDGLTTKLVLPGDQVKYLSVPTAGTDPDGYEGLAQRALDGATPYDLSELAVDWVEQDGQLHIAAVARETLSEAEAFAHEHQFNPVSFVAQPAEGEFVGEPFFGGTHAATELFGGPVDPDREAIRVIGEARLPEPEPEPEQPAAPETVPQPEEPPQPAPLIEAIGVPHFEILGTPEAAPDPATDTPAEPEDYEEATRLAELELGPAKPLSAEEEEILKAAQPETPAPKAEPPAPQPPVAAASDMGDAPVPSFSTVRAKRAAEASSAPPLAGAKRGSIPPSPGNEAPAPKKEPTPVAETKDGDPETAMLGVADSLRPTDPQVPERGSHMSLFKRSKAAKQEPAEPQQTSPEALPGTPPVPEPETEAQRLTVFGARGKDDRIGGKPRYLGLVLTALLLIFLVIAAAWASLSGDGLASLFGRDTPRTTAEALTPEEATEEELAELGTPATATTDPPGQEAIALPAPQPDAALDPELEPEPDLSTDVVESAEVPPDLPQPPTLQQTEERYATSGIWQMAPEQPAVPGTSALDDLYVASIDHPVLAFDAVALPDPQRILNDRTPPEQSDPVDAGTNFDFDQRGLVKATPEGALSPEGILIYSGPPPATPPKWPERQEDQGAIDTPQTTRLAGLRPKPRPEDLIEQTERSNLGGRTRVELAALRPRERPESAQELAGNEKPTELAVLASLKPKDRPSNFSAIVNEAQTSETQLATGSIFKPQQVQPTMPSKASVARQATVKNQINLRKINLIGVYGQTSDRRALVRLSNGRYKKVKVGDRIDGGKIAAIGETELRYVKSGRSITLTMPKG